MATIDRFKSALSSGMVFPDGHSVQLTAQMKYDYLAAVHTMDQLTNLNEELQSKKKRRAEFREKISNACKVSLKKIIESDEILTSKQINAAIKALKDCHDELLKIESVDGECEKLAKITEDGVSAGH